MPGRTPDPTTGARAVPIYQTTSYVFRDAEHGANLFGLKELGNIYTRLMNPTTDVFEKRMAALEGGTGAVAVASGMAAITYAVLTVTELGDEIVSGDNLYGGTYTLFGVTLPRLGRTVRFVDSTKPEAFRAAITEKTKAIYVEALGNPKLDVPDFEAIAAIAHEHGIPLIVDNTTARRARPPDRARRGHRGLLGHEVHRRPRHLDRRRHRRRRDLRLGQREVPGVHRPRPGLPRARLLGRRSGTSPASGTSRSRSGSGSSSSATSGAALSPFNAFQFLQGLETLPLRVQRHSENAKAVAEFLAAHPKVAWVNYPGLPEQPEPTPSPRSTCSGSFGPLVGFGVKGGKAASIAVIDRLRALQPPRERRGREVPGDPPGLDHAPAAHARGAARDRRDRGLHPARGRARGPGRPLRDLDRALAGV